MTRDEAIDRATAWLAVEGFMVDDLVLLREVFLAADHPFNSDPYDQWAVFYQSLVPDPDIHPNTLAVVVNVATGSVRQVGLM